MQKFKKYLCVSNETSRFSREDFLLDRVAWRDIKLVKNLADYDKIALNLTSLGNMKLLRNFESSELDEVLNGVAWGHILDSGGVIVVVGDPEVTVRVMRGYPKSACDTRPLGSLIVVTKDERPLDYRRVTKNDARGHSQVIYKYLDSVSAWHYSLMNCDFSNANLCGDTGAELFGFGVTTYKTVLAAEWEFRRSSSAKGSLVLLPPSGQGVDREDKFVLRSFFGVETSLPEPAWVRPLVLPGQTQIVSDIATKMAALNQLEKEIVSDEARLVACKHWYRLLYDDGPGLEGIVKEAAELVGASMTKTSTEKDDYRLAVSGFPTGVVEVKGTHNPKFGSPALRQLVQWMDDVEADEGIHVKGVFFGNASRNDPPQTRSAHIFEPNVHEYAERKGIVVLRTMDSYCLTILKLLGLLDTADLWKEFFGCKGAFDATRYWSALPQEFQLPQVIPQKAP